VKRLVWLLTLVCIASAVAYGAGKPTPKGRYITGTAPLPNKYPWLLARYVLAPLGVAEAQAMTGMGVITKDPCRGANWLLAAAKQHHIFAEMQLSGYYLITSEGGRDQERLKKKFLWWLHFESHFPDEPNESREVAAWLKLTPEQEQEVREKFKTWKPEDEPPIEPASCPGIFSWD
jgi:hypothetical protein